MNKKAAGTVSILALQCDAGLFCLFHPLSVLHGSQEEGGDKPEQRCVFVDPDKEECLERFQQLL